MEMCAQAPGMEKLLSPAIRVPRPRLMFPTSGWRARLEEHIGRIPNPPGQAFGVKLGPRAKPGAAEEAERALGRALPRDLRAFLLDVNGVELGFVTLFPLERLVEGTTNMRAWQEHELILPDVPVADVLGFAVDGADNYYGHRPDDMKAAHRVVYFCHDPPGWEHRFSSLESFIESALVRAHAFALWWEAETKGGKPIDDAPWTAVARSREVEIDPSMLRTRED